MYIDANPFLYTPFKNSSDEASGEAGWCIIVTSVSFVSALQGDGELMMVEVLLDVSCD